MRTADINRLELPADDLAALAALSMAETLERIEELLRPTVDIAEAPAVPPGTALFALPVDQEYTPDPTALRKPVREALDAYLDDHATDDSDDERLVERVLALVIGWSTGAIR